MPLILGHAAEAVVYVYPTVDAARSDRLGGTGFLAYVPLEGATQEPRQFSAPMPLDKAIGHLYVVTNRHNLLDPNDSRPFPEPAIVVRRLDNKRLSIPIVAGAWRTHHAGDDIAVAAVELPASTYHGAAFPNSGFITQEDVRQFGIGPGIDVYYTGRFQPGTGSPSITAFRFGAISAMPVKLRHPLFKIDVESYLIEGRARAGYSGSPVVPDLRGLRYNHEGGSSTLGYSDFLLGIHWGHLREWQEVEVRRLPEMRINLPEGVMTVAPAWRILDILKSEQVTAERKAAETGLRGKYLRS